MPIFLGFNIENQFKKKRLILKSILPSLNFIEACAFRMHQNISDISLLLCMRTFPQRIIFCMSDGVSVHKWSLVS